MSTITDTDRAGAIEQARPRVQRQHQGTGHYPVTVGGIVIGSVQRCVNKYITKIEIEWAVFDENGVQLPGAYSLRSNAVSALARTDHAARAYREAAREGTFGTAEERRVRAEDADALAAIDRELDETEPATDTFVARREADLAGERLAADAAAAQRDEPQPVTELSDYLRGAGFGVGYTKVDGQLVATAYAPNADSLDMLRRALAYKDVEIRETVASGVYALVPRSAQPATEPQEADVPVHQPTAEPDFLRLVAEQPPVISGITIVKVGEFSPGGNGVYACAQVIGHRSGHRPESAYSIHRLIWNDERRTWSLDSGHYDLNWDRAVEKLAAR